MREPSDGWFPRLIAAMARRTGLRVTGAQYLWLVWTAWGIAVLCTLFAVLINLGVVLLLSIFLVLWARSNVTDGRRVAALFDARRR
jgi:hypothetical protein